GADKEVVEAADRGEVAADRGRVLPFLGERGGIAAHLAVAKVGGPEVESLGPVDEGGEVDPVGAPGPLGGPAGPQITVVSGERRFPIHGCLIRPLPLTSCARHPTLIPDQRAGDQADQGRRKRAEGSALRCVTRRRATEDADMRRSPPSGYPIKMGVPTSTSS